MRILITSGGTAEKIDDVRAITNHSSGKLGATIAHSFFNEGHTIDYITTRTAVFVKEKTRLMVHYITDTKSLEKTMLRLLNENIYDAVIHAMAVSDYKTVQTATLEKIAHYLSENLQSTSATEVLNLLQNMPIENTENKISSISEQLVLFLEKTPKVIRHIKKIQPNTLLIGFKLLVDVSKESLLNVAFESLLKNQADYILANDLTQIHNEQHIGYLVDVSKQVEKYKTKQEIARGIVKNVEERCVYFGK